jgi:phosphatidate cytidylyltransferase
MSSNLIKRIITSFFLLSLLILMFFFSYILLISLLIISIISWIEFNSLISKIFKNKNFKDNIFKFGYKIISLLYLFLIVFLILHIQSNVPELRVLIFYSILISIMSDIGGLTVGKIFKGKKLTKISPNKTISGSVGSIIFSLILIPFFVEIVDLMYHELFIATFLISLTSQAGDIFISYLKRKAKVKDTSNILPGHGGLLDRIDGIIFAIPVGYFLLSSI